MTVTAGIGHAGLLLDVPADDWDRVVGTNAKGVWLAMRALAGPMLAAGGGSIVATSSVSARLADRTMGLYCVSKAALDMLIKVASVEWAPAVRVNGVAPGVTDTPMLGPAPRDRGWLQGVAERTALGRLGTADDVAEAVLAVHAMRWVTGEIVIVRRRSVAPQPDRPARRPGPHGPAVTSLTVRRARRSGSTPAATSGSGPSSCRTSSRRSNTAAPRC